MQLEHLIDVAEQRIRDGEKHLPSNSAAHEAQQTNLKTLRAASRYNQLGMDIAKFLASARAKMKIPKPRNDDAKISTKTKTGPEPRNEASASIDDAKISTKMKAGPESGSQGSASIDDAKISNKMKTGPESGSQGSAIDEDKISAKTVHKFANS